MAKHDYCIVTTGIVAVHFNTFFLNSITYPGIVPVWFCAAQARTPLVRFI